MSPKKNKNSQKNMTVCKFYLSSSGCLNFHCNFLHPNPAMQMPLMQAPQHFQASLPQSPSEIPCKFEASSGSCNKRKCQFLHQNDNINYASRRIKQRKSREAKSLHNSKSNIEDQVGDVDDSIDMSDDGPSTSTSVSVTLPEPSPTVNDKHQSITTTEASTAVKRKIVPEEAESQSKSAKLEIVNNDSETPDSHVLKGRYKLIKSYDKSGPSHLRKVSCLEGDTVTYEGRCKDKDHPNCSFVEIKTQQFNVTGFIPRDHLSTELIKINCPLYFETKCQSSKLDTEDAYLEHLCLEHFVDKFEFLKGSSLFKCPEPKCGKSCCNVKNLILHYGASYENGHEKVLNLLLQPETLGKLKTGDDVLLKSEQDPSKKENTDYKKELETMKVDFDDMEKERDDLDGQVIDLRKEKSLLESKMKEFELKNRKLIDENRSLTKTNEALLLSSNESVAKIEEQKQLNELNKNLKKEVIKLGNRSENSEREIKVLQHEMKELNKRYEAEIDAKNKLKEELENKEVEYKNLENDLEAMENERDELDNDLSKTKQELSETQVKLLLNNRGDSSQNSNEAERDLEEKILKLESILDTQKQTINEANENSKKNYTVNQQQKNLIKNLNAKITESEKEKNVLNKQIADTKSNVEALVKEVGDLISCKSSLQKRLSDEEAEKNEKCSDMQEKFTTIETQYNLLKEELKLNQDNILSHQSELKKREEQIEKFQKDLLPFVKNYFGCIHNPE